LPLSSHKASSTIALLPNIEMQQPLEDRALGPISSESQPSGQRGQRSSPFGFTGSVALTREASWRTASRKSIRFSEGGGPLSDDPDSPRCLGVGAFSGTSPAGSPHPPRRLSMSGATLSPRSLLATRRPSRVSFGPSAVVFAAEGLGDVGAESFWGVNPEERGDGLLRSSSHVSRCGLTRLRSVSHSGVMSDSLLPPAAEGVTAGGVKPFLTVVNSSEHSDRIGCGCYPFLMDLIDR
jgi:hypothetical protein